MKRTDEPRRRREPHAGLAGTLAGLLALLLFLLPGTPPPPAASPEGGDGAAAPRPEGQAQLEVRVTDADGQPVERARVRVQPEGQRGVAWGRTDADGRAVIERLPAGEAEVRVERSGFARAETTVRVGGGKPVSVRLGPGAKVAGVVLDPAGEPVSNAEVTASVGPERPPWELRTDLEGGFEIDTLPPGPVSLAIRAEGFDGAQRRVTAEPDPPTLRIVLERTALVAGQVYRADGGPAEGTTVVLAGSGVWPPRRMAAGADGRFRFEGLPGGVYEVQARQDDRVAPPREGLVLEPGAEVFLALRLEKGAGLRGRVVDAATDEPVAGAEVTLTEETLALAPRTARTGEDGQFAFAGLRRRPHRLSVHAEGYVARVGETVEPTGGEPLELSLRPGAVLSGVVVDALDYPVEGARLEVVGRDERGELVTLSGGAVGLRASLAGGEELGTAPGSAGGLGVTQGPVPPIPAVPLAPSAGGSEAVPLAPGPTGAAPTAAPEAGGFVTDEEGRFRLTGIPPGRVQLIARHDAHAPGLTRPRIVTAGEEADDLRVVMPEAGTIAGRVVDKRGFPVSGIAVEMRVEREPVPTFAVSEEDGTFTLEGALGAVVLTALPDGQPASRTRVEVPPGEEVEVELALSRARTTLYGRTVDPRGFPLAGVQVEVRSLDASTPVQRTAFSTDDGTFTVEGLPLPPYRVEANHPGYAPTRLARVAEVEDELQVRLEPGAPIAGRVLDDWSGEPVEGAELTLRAVGGGALEPETTRSDSSGFFEYSMVSAGDYELIVKHPDHLKAELGVSHGPGPRGLEERTLDPIRLEAAGTVAGEVVDALGSPVSGAEVAAGRPPRWPEAARTDPQGRFELTGLPPGDVRLTARHPAAGQAPALGPTPVRPKERTPGVRIHLPERFDPDRADPGEGIRTGVAVRVERARGGAVRVAWVAPGSRADRAGLRTGDRIEAIDDVEPASVAEARELLRGPAGIEAVLEVERDGRAQRVIVARERWME